ncbi:hypothetical protein P7C73_g3414, partial [Tremellales sp. Uapishka_1]
MTNLMETILIHPEPMANPHIPAGTTHLPLSDVALWTMGPVPSWYVFPGRLDVERFTQAVRKVTASWPNVCGRYVHTPEQGYSIHLTHSPIPLTVLTLSTALDLQELDGRPTVIQPQAKLAPYIPMLEGDYHLPNVPAHLLTLQITYFPDDRCVLAVNWAHILGDAATANTFLRDLSAAYADDAGTASLSQPMFFPHVDLSGTKESSKHPHQVLHQVVPTPVAEAKKAYADSAADCTPFNIRIPMAWLQAEKKRWAEQGIRVSEQDVINGWWVELLDKMGDPVDRVIYTISVGPPSSVAHLTMSALVLTLNQYRTFHAGSPEFPSSLPTLASNVAQMLGINLPASPSGSPAAMLAIRNATNDLRTSPALTLQWIARAASLIRSAADHQMCQLVLAKPGEGIINSNLRQVHSPLPPPFSFRRTAMPMSSSSTQPLDTRSQRHM